MPVFASTSSIFIVYLRVDFFKILSVSKNIACPSFIVIFLPLIKRRRKATYYGQIATDFSKQYFLLKI